MLDFLGVNGYILSVTMLLLSTFVSATELASIPSLYLDLVFPGTGRISKRTIWLGLHLFQCFFAVLTWLALNFGDRDYFRYCFLLLGAAVAASYWLRTAGKDGADQLRLLSFLAYSIGFLLDGKNQERIPMYFLGAQIIIAYATAGTVKMFSEYWQNGDVVSRILAGYSYGWPRIGKFLSAHPLLDRTCTYSPIAMMLLVPAAFLLPFQTPLLVALGLTFCFHLGAAIFMGLNDFVVTFSSAYPGLILLHAWVVS
jgi:hypothetical protein